MGSDFKSSWVVQGLGYMGVIEGNKGIMEKKMETTIEGLAFRVQGVDPWLINPRPFKSPKFRIRITLTIKGRGGGLFITGLH